MANHFSILGSRTSNYTMRRQKDTTLEDERLVGVQYATGEKHAGYLPRRTHTHRGTQPEVRHKGSSGTAISKNSNKTSKQENLPKHMSSCSPSFIQQ